MYITTIFTILTWVIVYKEIRKKAYKNVAILYLITLFFMALESYFTIYQKSGSYFQPIFFATLVVTPFYIFLYLGSRFIKLEFLNDDDERP
jgi:hypothetical protein